MLETENQPEVVEQSTDQVVGQQVAEQPLVEEKQPEQKDSFQAKNFRELKEKAFAVQRERDELSRRLQEMEAKNKPQPLPEPIDDDIVIGPDELAEGKHLNKMNKKMKQLEDQLKAYQQQSSLSNAETRLRSEFQDFDKVFTRENIETLAMLEPDIAHTLDQSTDSYRKAKSAYLFIKKMGIAPEDNYKEEKELIQRNAAKPKTLASIAPQQGSEGALSRANAFANGLTDELKQQLYKEMMEARKGY